MYSEILVSKPHTVSSRHMLSSLALSVADTIKKHEMLASNQRVLIGLSGGADSVSLLLVLRELGYSVGAAHVNHGLRGAESYEDERFVIALAAHHQVPFFSRTIAISADDGNIEAAGRAARREFLERVMAEERFDKIAV